jgi:hypothetical protein
MNWKKVIKSFSNIVGLLNNFRALFPPLLASSSFNVELFMSNFVCFLGPTTNKSWSRLSILPFFTHFLHHSPMIDDPFADCSEQLPYPKSRRMQRVNKTISRFLLHEISFEFFFRNEFEKKIAKKKFRYTFRLFSVRILSALNFSVASSSFVKRNKTVKSLNLLTKQYFSMSFDLKKN